MFDYLDERCNGNYCYSLIYIDENDIVTKDPNQIAGLLKMNVEELKDTVDKFNKLPMNIEKFINDEIDFIAFDNEIAAFNCTEYLDNLIKMVA